MTLIKLKNNVVPCIIGCFISNIAHFSTKYNEPNDNEELDLCQYKSKNRFSGKRSNSVPSGRAECV